MSIDESARRSPRRRRRRPHRRRPARQPRPRTPSSGPDGRGGRAPRRRRHRRPPAGTGGHPGAQRGPHPHRRARGGDRAREAGGADPHPADPRPGGARRRRLPARLRRGGVPGHRAAHRRPVLHQPRHLPPARPRRRGQPPRAAGADLPAHPPAVAGRPRRPTPRRPRVARHQRRRDHGAVHRVGRRRVDRRLGPHRHHHRRHGHLLVAARPRGRGRLHPARARTGATSSAGSWRPTTRCARPSAGPCPRCPSWSRAHRWSWPTGCSAAPAPVSTAPSAGSTRPRWARPSGSR